ncbi:hypothetical protein H6G41_19985 [Tolypothrix sp. FACHB-123]|nr:hypothetical protein [Tolypothrix sp. FACHB-123]MBD2356878.1 hypothetical protein [Tolypothrix sp. FACHB-123]
MRYRLSFIVGALALPCPEARTSFTGNMLYVETQDNYVSTDYQNLMDEFT